MTIHVRNFAPRVSDGDWRSIDPFDHYPDTPRYCASCGCRLRKRNRARICNPCEDRAADAHYKRQAWLLERGLL